MFAYLIPLDFAKETAWLNAVCAVVWVSGEAATVLPFVFPTTGAIVLAV